ncbi:MAG: alpha/beta hydrolase [Verrucomicrobia bacterium]|nr:alpha/beta hydrolase [Verrucomicrobiota bacterium]MBI3867589.1 alpha/beta hydrolase [Verrucomicrobiota bacterium]
MTSNPAAAPNVPQRATKRMMPLFVKLVLVVVGAFLFLRWFEYKQVYHPSSVWLTDQPAAGRSAQDVFLTTGDGVKIHCLFYAAAETSPRAGVVWCYFHGNGGNLSMRPLILEALLSTGVNLLAVDYHGYGRSEGRPSERGTYRDAEAAYDWLIHRGFDPARIIAHGESLGGGVASYLASARRVGGLVIQSSYTTLPDIGRERFPWLPVRLAGSIQYPTRERLSGIRVPVMIMHSPSDQLMPFHHGQENFAAANEPKMFWTLNARHNDFVASDGANYRAGLAAFLDRYFPCPPVVR